MFRRNSIKSYKSLSVFYYIAISTIIIVLISNQILMQYFMSRLEGDSRIINLAGRQRMLSQKLTKEAILLTSTNGIKKNDVKEKLANTLNLWMTSHRAIQYGNMDLGIPLTIDSSEEIQQKFVEITPSFDNIVVLIQNIIRTETATSSNIEELLTLESVFLDKMNDIVFQYDDENKEKIKNLKKGELFLLVIGLFILGFEVLFVFQPLLSYIKKYILDLVKSEENLSASFNKIEDAYNELELSYNTLNAINRALNHSMFYATADPKGIIKQVSENFRNKLNLSNQPVLGEPIHTLLQSRTYDDSFLDQLLVYIAENKTWSSEIHCDALQKDCWLDFTIVPVINHQKQLNQILILANDITKRKNAEEELRIINEEKIIKEVKEHQYRSLQILEAQEEERKRIARDIHDGIGQYLTALKYNISSIKTIHLADEKLTNKIIGIKSLIDETIKECRRVSFNLTPNELTDYGFVAAAKNFVVEINKVTDVEIIFENTTNFNERLDIIIERNLYRILQEAVNNALKYSKANKIFVILSETKNILTLSIQDNGVGFDANVLIQNNVFKISGHGIFNMKERASFINAKFNVKTAPKRGTQIIIDLPINQ